MDSSITTNEHQQRPGRRLGRRRPSGKPALRLRDFVVAAPSHSPATDHFSRISDWGLYGNDQYGDCGPTSVANSRKLTTAYLTGKEQSPPQSAVFDLYKRSGNPNFDPATDADDNGVDMQTMCEALVSGGIGGTKALGFAKVDVGDLQMVDAAVDIFGFLLLGVTLEDAQQAQTNNRVWDYSKSPIWGGHAVLLGRYSEGGVERRGVITWAEAVDMTDAFIKYQLDEAWAVIWPEHLQNPAFQSGIDVQKFANAYQAITGKKFPADIPPAPIPTPQPTPAPTPSAGIVLAGDVLAHVTSASHRRGVSPQDYVNNHFRSYFNIEVS